MRAYSEINDFEAQMAKSGTILLKCWLAISKEEQLRRFEERQSTQFKRFKITEEDWRNREKWDAYEAAICDMFDRTSTEIAPLDPGGERGQALRAHQDPQDTVPED